MKNATTTKMMLAAVLLTAASTVASAQAMKAEIPFAFHAAGKAMPAGVYRVTAAKAESQFELVSSNTRDRILLVPHISQDPQKSWKNGKSGVLQFVCGARGCALAQIWNYGSTSAHVITIPNPAERLGAHVALIRMVRK